MSRHRLSYEDRSQMWEIPNVLAFNRSKSQPNTIHLHDHLHDLSLRNTRNKYCLNSTEPTHLNRSNETHKECAQSGEKTFHLETCWTPEKLNNNLAKLADLFQNLISKFVIEQGAGIQENTKESIIRCQKAISLVRRFLEFGKYFHTEQNHTLDITHEINLLLSKLELPPQLFIYAERIKHLATMKLEEQNRLIDERFPTVESIEKKELINSIERLSFESMNPSHGELSEDSIRQALMRNQERLIKDLMVKNVREIIGPKHKQQDSETAPKTTSEDSVEWEDFTHSNQTSHVPNKRNEQENPNEKSQNTPYGDIKGKNVLGYKAKHLDLRRFNIRAPFADEMTHPKQIHAGNACAKSIDFLAPNISQERNLLNPIGDFQNELSIKPLQRLRARSQSEFWSKLEEPVPQYTRSNSNLLSSNVPSEEEEYKKKLQEKLRIRQQQLEEMNRMILIYKKQVDDLQQESLLTLKGASKSSAQKVEEPTPTHKDSLDNHSTANSKAESNYFTPPSNFAMRSKTTLANKINQEITSDSSKVVDAQPNKDIMDKKSIPNAEMRSNLSVGSEYDEYKLKEIQRHFYARCLAFKLKLDSHHISQKIPISAIFQRATQQNIKQEEWDDFIKNSLAHSELYIDLHKAQPKDIDKIQNRIKEIANNLEMKSRRKKSHEEAAVNIE